jgi:mycothiol S-conjugate amidase
MAAYEAAGDPARWPDAGEPWRPAKLYYTAVARSRIKNFGRLLREAGIEPPFEGGEAREPDIGTPDELITTEIDVSRQVERKRRALMAHASQMGPDVFFAKMPPALFHQVFGRESFRLARGQSGTSGLERDLFAGLR